LMERANQHFFTSKSLDGTNGRKETKELYTFILSNLRDFNQAQVAVIHGALFKGSKSYPNGLRVADILTEFKSGQFVTGKMTGRILVHLIEGYRNSGDKHLFMQADDSVVFAPGTNTIVSIGGAPPQEGRIYDVLFPLDLAVMRDEHDESLSKDLDEWFKAHPKLLNFNPNHQPPVISKSIVSALIRPDWVELFQGHTLQELDLNHDGKIDLSELQQMVGSEEVATALMEALDTNHDGVLDAAELEVVLAPVGPARELASSRDGKSSSNSQQSTK